MYNTPWNFKLQSGSSPEKGYGSLQILLDMVALDQGSSYLNSPRIHPRQEVETAFNNVLQTWKSGEDYKQLLHMLE